MKRLFVLGFSFFLLMSSWEGQLTMANVLDNGPIPQESIRLRIIANSDSFQDQWLKREVRDALIAKMNSWSGQINSYEQAQQFVAVNLPELQQVVDETIRDRGFDYHAVVDFGQVPFPTKLYGSYVYPAGNYQAVRVSIGEAKGQNWWCVLFPPLCFIDMSNGDAVAASTPGREREQTEREDAVATYEAADSESVESESLDGKVTARTVSNPHREWQYERLHQRDEIDFRMGLDQTPDAIDSEESVAAVQESVQKPAQSTPGVEVRFYLWEKLEKLFS